jgi:hypothetical protein
MVVVKASHCVRCWVNDPGQYRVACVCVCCSGSSTQPTAYRKLRNGTQVISNCLCMMSKTCCRWQATVERPRSSCVSMTVQDIWSGVLQCNEWFIDLTIGVLCHFAVSCLLFFFHSNEKRHKYAKQLNEVFEQLHRLNDRYVDLIISFQQELQLSVSNVCRLFVGFIGCKSLKQRQLLKYLFPNWQ